ncbi:MAG: ORF6N domain-containing protein [Pseudomonadota bacterium]
MIDHVGMIPMRTIEERIFLIRGQRVMIDADLANLYGVSTKRLHEQVKRNIARFPPDFMLTLTSDELKELVANCDQFKKLKHSSVLPRAFAEHGALMLASVLNTPRAIEVSVLVVRAFVKLREILSTHKELVYKLNELERNIATHDKAIQSLFAAIRQLMKPPESTQRRIGFYVKQN